MLSKQDLMLIEDYLNLAADQALEDAAEAMDDEYRAKARDDHAIITYLIDRVATVRRDV